MSEGMRSLHDLGRLFNDNYGIVNIVNHADKLEFASGAISNCADNEQPLMAYITDPVRRREVVRELASIPDLETLCRTTLWNLYNGELNDVKGKDTIVVSATFIQALIPLLKSCGNSCTVANIRSAIHRYILNDLDHN